MAYETLRSVVLGREEDWPLPRITGLCETVPQLSATVSDVVARVDETSEQLAEIKQHVGVLLDRTTELVPGNGSTLLSKLDEIISKLNDQLP